MDPVIEALRDLYLIKFIPYYVIRYELYVDLRYKFVIVEYESGISCNKFNEY